LRLVIPYQITQRAPTKNRRRESKKFVKVYKDVIVDKVVMERHTTGIDPFTGTDYGHAEIPKEHQYDPQTGLPIFHRYIAGTQQRIQWPWEKPAEVPHSGTTHKSKTGRQTWIKRTLGTLRHPIASIKQLTSKNTEAVSTVERKHKDMSEKLMEIEQQALEVQKTRKPRSSDPRFRGAFDITDTTRNIVEGADSMSYTLVAPPFPDTLGEELRGHIQDFTAESRKNQDKNAPAVKRPKRVTEQGRIASEMAKAKHAAALSMKTPMQLRWETEHAKKIKQQKDAPLVSTDELMAALGRHIQQKKAMKSSARLEELD
jgi:large subunit ribosomal protein L24